MRDVKQEITKKDYLKYQSNPAAYSRERHETIPIQWECGYGWYGCYCYESGTGHYYRVDRLGESCD